MWDYQDIKSIKQLIDVGRYNEALQSIILYTRKLPTDSRERAEAEVLHIDLLIRAGYLRDTLIKVNSLGSTIKKYGFNDIQIDLCLLRIQIDQQLGEYGQSIKNISKAKDIFISLSGKEQTLTYYRWARILFSEGIQFWYEGDLDSAIHKLREVIEIQKNGEKNSEYVRTLSNYGRMLCEKGNFREGLPILEEALQLEQSIGNRASIATIMANIGRIHHLKGHLEEALQYLQDSLLIWEKMENFSQIRFNLADIGTIYRQKGDFHQALNYIQRSLAIAEKIGNPNELSWFLFEIFRVFLEMDAIENAQISLAKMYNFKLSTVNRKIDLRYRLAKALMLRKKGRAKDLFMAQDIFKKVAEEPVIEQEITQIALLNLCELILIELRLNANTQLLEELDFVIAKLLEIAENQHSYLLWAEVYLLKAKLALIDLKVDEARKNLNQAQLFAEDSGLVRIAMKISEEHDKLIAQQQIWESFQEKDASFLERAEIVGLDGYLSNIVHQKGFAPSSVKPEIPVALIIVNENGPIIYFRSFSTIGKFDKEMLGGFLTAFDIMSDEIFAQNLDRAKFGEFNVLVKKHSPILVGYVYQGPSFYAQKKILQFYEDVMGNDQLYDAFLKYTNNQMILSEILTNFIDIMCDQIMLKEMQDLAD
ncbi:MAG: tetratricopeptide repeat protein [Promethearchaeota archaeon]